MKKLILLLSLIPFIVYGQGGIVRVGSVSTVSLTSNQVVSIVQAVGGGVAATNVLEKNVQVTTNGWGTSVIDFSLGTHVLTNMSGNLTVSGIVGFNNTNLNWQTIALNPNGATRVLTIPVEFWASGFFTNSTIGIITNATRAKLSVECVIGHYTNVSLDISQ